MFIDIVTHFQSLQQLTQQQPLMQTIQDSARGLLSLEPYFDGEFIRESLKLIKTNYHQVSPALHRYIVLYINSKILSCVTDRAFTGMQVVRNI